MSAFEIRRGMDQGNFMRDTWSLWIDGKQRYYDKLLSSVKAEAVRRGASGKWRRESRGVRGREVAVYVDAGRSPNLTCQPPSKYIDTRTRLNQ